MRKFGPFYVSERSSNTTKIETLWLRCLLSACCCQKEVLTQQRLKLSLVVCLLCCVVSERSSNTTKIETRAPTFHKDIKKGQKEVLTQQRLKRVVLPLCAPSVNQSERSSNTTKIETPCRDLQGRAIL